MKKDEFELGSLVLAPYILKAMILSEKERLVGGNMFRHSMATLSILFNYRYYSDPVLLKASVIHDLLEDVPSTNSKALKSIDKDARRVVKLVLEVTKKEAESKPDFLKRILDTGTKNAKILKVADRINNLTEINTDVFSTEWIINYLDDSERFILPMALQVNNNMAKELKDLIIKRRADLKKKT